MLPILYSTCTMNASGGYKVQFGHFSPLLHLPNLIMKYQLESDVLEQRNPQTVLSSGPEVDTGGLCDTDLSLHVIYHCEEPIAPKTDRKESISSISCLRRVGRSVITSCAVRNCFQGRDNHKISK